MSDDVDSKFEPVTARDVTDEKLVAGQLRALQLEVREGFELMGTRLLTMLERIELKMDVLTDRVTRLERDRIDDRESVLRINERVVALENKRPKRTRRK